MGIVVSAAAPLQAVSLRTQSERAAEPYTLSGRVVTAGGGAVASAEIIIVEPRTAERSAKADSAGRFEATLAGPSAVLRVRGAGYVERTVYVTMKPDSHASTVTIELDPAAKKADGAMVADSVFDVDVKLRDFYARKAAVSAMAHFIDSVDIAKKRPRVLSEMLRPLPGIVLQPSSRVGNIVLIRGCSPLVWVDGVRMPAMQLDEVAAPDDVAAMEVYKSFAGIPSRYFDRTATCGTVLVWLKS